MFKHKDKTGSKAFKKACQLYDQKDYTQAIEQFEQSATDGFLRANFRLGQIYFEGIAVEKDYRKALEWFTIYDRLVEDDHEVEYYLGQIYYLGTDRFPQDLDLAFRWIQKSAQNGNPEAQLILGLMYLNGEGTDPSPAEAYRAFEIAVLHTSRAQFQLGYCFHYGIGVEPDLEKALICYRQYLLEFQDGLAYFSIGELYQTRGELRKAIQSYGKAFEAGHVKAALALGKIYFEGPARNYQLAFRWLTKDEDSVNHDAETQYYIGRILYHGDGLRFRKNKNKSYVYTMAAAKNGHPEAQLCLGLMSLNGEFVKKNDKNAFAWFEKAAQSNLPKVQFHLAHCYQHGIGVEPDLDRALEYYQDYLKHTQDGVAYYNLGNIYRIRGNQAESNYLKAIEYYKMAVKHGHVSGISRIASMYLNGEGVEKDLKKAFELFYQASYESESDAIYNLGKMYYHGHYVPQNYDTALEYFAKLTNLPQDDTMEEVQSYIDRIRTLKNSNSDLTSLQTPSNYQQMNQTLDTLLKQLLQNDKHDLQELLLLMGKLESMHNTLEDLINNDQAVLTQNLYSLSINNKPTDYLILPKQKEFDSRSTSNDGGSSISTMSLSQESSSQLDTK